MVSSDRDMCARSLTRQNRIEKDKASLTQRLAWAECLIDKQYRLYAWNDGKIQLLAAVNGLLFTAAGVVFRDGPANVVSAAFLAIAAIFLAMSLLGCLTAIKVFPLSRRSREKGDDPNLRSLKGISDYPSWRDYADQFGRVDLARFLEHTLRQIWGMSINNLSSHARMKRAVNFTQTGAISILLALSTQVAPVVEEGLPASAKGYLPRILTHRINQRVVENAVVKSTISPALCPMNAIHGRQHRL